MPEKTKWARIEPATIANTCSPKHIQSVLEDAQETISDLLEALKDLVDNGMGTEAVKRARAAIRKATE